MSSRDSVYFTYDPTASSVWRQRGERLLDELFLPACLGCDAVATGGCRNLLLCASCRHRLKPLRPPRCPLCACRLEVSATPGFSCSLCRGRSAGYDRLTALWSYEPPLDACIRALKFGRIAALAAPFGHALATRLAPDARDLDAIVAVPLHWRRKLGRGFDQAEEIAGSVAARLGLPLLRTLRRRRATTAQSLLPLVDRHRNVSRAFGLRRGAGVKNLRILLVDDVVTSGSTLRSAALTLRRAGAATVEAAVVARAPSPAGRPERRT